MTTKALDPSQFTAVDTTDIDAGIPIPDSEQEAPGRLIVLRYPVKEKTDGGLHIPHPSQRHPECVAWVLHSTHGLFARGDTVLAPERIFQNELVGLGPDIFGINTRDAWMWFPDPKNPVEKRDKENGDVRTQRRMDPEDRLPSGKAESQAQENQKGDENGSR